MVRIDLPGSDIFELPPFFTNYPLEADGYHDKFTRSLRITQEEFLVPQDFDPDDPVYDVVETKIAADLAAGYDWLAQNFLWGSFVFKWIASCNEYIGNDERLAALASSDIYPHLNRFSLIKLLLDKKFPPRDYPQNLRLGISLALHFRKLPSVDRFTPDCLRNRGQQFLSGYDHWEKSAQTTAVALPHERFRFVLVLPNLSSVEL